MELKQYWNVVKKRLWLILLLAIAAGSISGVYSYYFIQPQYEASTKLIVNQTDVSLSTINSNIQLLKTYKELVKTPRIMNEVAASYPDLGLTPNQIAAKLTISSINETQIMSIIVRDQSYERAARIANAVSIVFQQEVPKLMNVDNISILNEADPNGAPVYVSPNLMMNVLIAFVLAFMATLGIVFFLDYLDDTIKTEEDVESILKLPVLSSIPGIKVSDLSKFKAKSVKEPVRSGKNVKFEA